MAEGCLQKIPDRHCRQAVLRLPGLEPNQILVSHLNLGGVLDQQNSFVLRDELSNDIQERGLLRCRACLKSDGLTDNERDGLGLGFAATLRTAATSLVAVHFFVGLCCAQHKPIYVAMRFMWRSAQVPAESKGNCLNKRHIILLRGFAGTPLHLDCCARVSLAT